MNNKLSFILILGGLTIAGIVWMGVTQTSKKSDAEYIQEGLQAQRAAQQEASKTRAELSAMVLIAPDACEGVKTKIFYDIVEGEPYSGNDWPDWTSFASPQEVSCILEAFYRTNEHAFKTQGKSYNREAPSIGRSSKFVLDVAGASLSTDGIDYGDTDKSAVDLLNGFYAERAESSYAPSRDY